MCSSIQVMVQALALAVSLQLGSGTHGLTFSRQPNSLTETCQELFCFVDFPENDPRVFAIVSLTISELTPTNETTSLVSISTFSPQLDIEPTRADLINGSGTASRYSAYLTISFNTDVLCSSGSFQCELDFVNRSGQSEKQRITLLPMSEDSKWPSVINLLTNVSSQVKTQSAQVEVKISSLEQKVEALTRYNLLVSSKLDDILREMSLLDGISLPVPDISQIQCRRGMAHSQSREKINLWNQRQALCDTVSDGGGWVVIQRRTTGDVDFYRDWNSYKNGFGTADTDYWIGNDVIHNLTSQGYNQLRVDVTVEDVPNFVHYSIFTVANEAADYHLIVGGAYGNLADILSDVNHMNFSTFDRDYDSSGRYNCATQNRAGWWYGSCAHANLNGPWGQHNATGLVIYQGGSYKYPSSVEMKIRLN